MTRKKVRVDRRAWERMRRVLRDADGRAVKVGVIGPDDSELAVYAAANEFGTETIPERSFIRHTTHRHQSKYAKGLERGLTKVVEGRLTLDRMLGLIGAEVVKDIQVADGAVRVEIDLPSDHQFAANIREEIMEKVEPLWDVKQVTVEFSG